MTSLSPDARSTMKTITRFAVACFVLVMASAVDAAEIKVLCSNGIRAVIEDLAPQFERETKHKVTLLFEPSTRLKTRIEAGEPFDLTVLTPALIDEVIKSGKVAAGSRTVLARSGLGISMRAGSRKPDISTVAAFKRALTAAKSLTYASQGASAAPFEALVEKLGLTSQLKPKYSLRDTAAQVGEAVASGAVELGVAPVSEILPVKGVELVGPFPADIQSYVVMVGGVGTNARDKDAAKRLLDFVIAPANLPVIKAKGMER
jgi:molybdate transport system substrate-binding protein